MNQETSNHPEVNKTAEASGTVSKFLYNVHGDADGFILNWEKQIHFPPHLSVEVLKSVKVGDKVHVYGKSLNLVGLTIAASIALPGGTTIVDNGPPEKPHKH